MKKKEIEKLVKDCAPTEDITIKVLSNIECQRWSAMIAIDIDAITLYINRLQFSSKIPEDNQISIILHELGHIYSNSRSVVQEEYLAQKWGILKAREKGWKNIEKILVKDIEDWGKFGWNEEGGRYRRYILASKLFEEEIKDD